ncbi:MAG: valine--tRNA ligase, partial [Bacteroidales bacterium]|nr:valine--tRNA ligase [Bacteroidales bacterium]
LQSKKEADKILSNFETVKEIITNIRNIRASKNISPKEKLTLQITATQEEIDKMFFTGSDYDSVGTDRVIMKLANIEEIKMVTEKSAGAVSFLVGTTEYAVPVGNLINAEEEIDKAEKEIARLEGFLKSVQAKLSNEKFVANAKPEVVEVERKKQADAESKIKALMESIENLRKNK